MQRIKLPSMSSKVQTTFWGGADGSICAPSGNLQGMVTSKRLFFELVDPGFSSI